MVDGLKRSTTISPVLALQIPAKHYTFDNHACNTKVGCTLLQELPDGHNQLIGYWLRTLSESKKNCPKRTRTTTP